MEGKFTFSVIRDPDIDLVVYDIDFGLGFGFGLGFSSGPRSTALTTVSLNGGGIY